MTKNVIKRPARLDIVDMPRDKTRALGGLRQALCSSFNYCRKYPAKMAVLKEVLKYTYNRIVAWEKEHAAQLEQQAKIRLEEAGALIGIELDSRKSVENMTKDLAKGQAAYDEEQARLAQEAAEAEAAQLKLAEEAKLAKNGADAEANENAKEDSEPKVE